MLITESAYEILSARLPRSPEEVEKIMAEGANERGYSKMRFIPRPD